MITAAIALALSVSPGLMQPQAARPLMMQEVALTFAVQPHDWTAFYPKAVRTKGARGSAEVMCRVGADQKLTDCATIAEFPAGAGFGASAANLFSLMQVAPRAADGTATANRQIVLHHTFKLDNQG